LQLLPGVSIPSSSPVAHGYALLAAPGFTAENSYLIHPALMQAAVTPNSDFEEATLASVQGVLLPCSVGAGAGIAALAAPVDCSWAALVSKTGRNFGFNGATYLPARPLGLNPASSGLDASELLYNIDWQATAPALVPVSMPTKLSQGALLFRAAGLYKGDEAVAGAEVARVLAHHREILPSNELTMISASSITPVATPTHVHDHVAAALVSGVLKNLPYELPDVKLQMVDQDTSTKAAGSFALTSGHPAASSDWGGADMYGAVSSTGAVYRPLLSYGSNTSYPSPPLSTALTADSSAKSSSSKTASIITGGLGGLGSMTASWASGLGVGALILLGRSGCLASGAWSGAGSLLQSDSLVVMAKADASFAEDASEAIQLARNTSFPLASIVHAAGVQVEARLLKQTTKTMRQTAAPKLAAFRQCLGAAPGAPLTSNLLFSSVSSVTGNANHSNYAGANAALDALAEQHASQGTTVASVQWGAWASVGMVHRNYRISSQQAAAMGMLSSEAGLAAMARVLQTIGASPAVVLGAAPKSYWTNLLQNAPGVPAIFSSFDLPKPAIVASSTALMTSSAAAASGPATKEDVEAIVRRVASSILGTTDLDAAQPLALQGLDSLAGLELRQKLQEALGGVELALLAEDPQGATISSIVEEAFSKVSALRAAASSTALVPAGGAAAQAAIAAAKAAAEVAAGPLWISPTPVTIKMRIFCLPWAGGMSENLFARWSMMLPASVQVCPVEIPGRGRREGETALTTVDELAKVLAHSLPLQDKPYVIFGTCLGAIVGYEIIREVQKTGCAPPPVAFMPAAVSPPHVYASVVMKIYLQRRLRRGEQPPLDEVLKILKGWKEMPREKLLLAFEAGHFAGVEEMKKSERLFNRVAPMGVNDIMMAVQYRYDPTHAPFNFPIIAFDGTKDNTIPNGYMKGWRRHTTARYRHVYIKGTHYFVSTHYREVTTEVGGELMALMEEARGGILGAGHSWVGGGENEGKEEAAGGGDDFAAASTSSQQQEQRQMMLRVAGQALPVLALVLMLIWWFRYMQFYQQ
jgi:surfactin synthase thioesterase subunit